MATSAQNDADEVLGRIGLALPEGARIEYVELMKGHDDAARLILTMPEAAWQRWSTQAPLDAVVPARYSTDSQFHLGQDSGAWTPRTDKTLKVAQTPWNDGREAFNIGVSEPRDGAVRVYIFWHQL